MWSAEIQTFLTLNIMLFESLCEGTGKREGLKGLEVWSD